MNIHLPVAFRIARQEMHCWEKLTERTRKNIWRSYDHLLNIEKNIFAPYTNRKVVNPIERRIEAVFR